MSKGRVWCRIVVEYRSLAVYITLYIDISTIHESQFKLPYIGYHVSAYSSIKLLILRRESTINWMCFSDLNSMSLTDTVLSGDIFIVFLVF